MKSMALAFQLVFVQIRWTQVSEGFSSATNNTVVGQDRYETVAQYFCNSRAELSGVDNDFVSVICAYYSGKPLDAREK